MLADFAFEKIRGQILYISPCRVKTVSLENLEIKKFGTGPLYNFDIRSELKKHKISLKKTF